MKNQIVKEWVQRGTSDLEVAKLLLERNEYFGIILFHIQQAIEKYSKGYLILKGW